MTSPALGVCYYPEHWPEALWTEDAGRMAAAGISHVRVSEFAWSRLEPARDAFEFDWLRRAIDTLAQAGLKVVMCTPTATPPKWLVDEMPDMLAVDAQGRRRGFGSRRHYDFSHEGYRDECRRIVAALGQAFGEHPAVVAWQTDNEYGCHDTVHSYSAAARDAFRDWLARKYQSPQALNRAWGNVFWSMEYASFEEIELPAGAVTEANPAHRLDFMRFSSEQVASFNRLQVDILRKLSPGRDIVHNFMGRTLSFDHFALGADLDVSAWDAYPLGFLDSRSDMDDDWKRDFLRSGDPDFQAFHHDLYRATSKGRWWIMEQQPGPVNWSLHNPVPRAGMVRLWTWEAFAHGAELVSYFRWRQAPFAQEQMHAGLLRPDSSAAEGLAEVETVAAELTGFAVPAAGVAEAAIVFDYESAWAWAVQPQGAEFDYFRLVFNLYRGLRRLGLSVDIVPAETEDFGERKLVLVPGLFAWNDKLLQAMRNFAGTVLVGPRSGSKTKDFAIPPALPPGLGAMLDARVSRVETLPAHSTVDLEGGGAFKFWRELLEAGDGAEIVRRSADGAPAMVRQGRLHYLAGWPDEAAAGDILSGLAREAGLATRALPDGVRLRRSGDLTFAFNYGAEPFDLARLGIEGVLLLGETVLPPSGVTVMRTR